MRKYYEVEIHVNNGSTTLAFNIVKVPSFAELERHFYLLSGLGWDMDAFKQKCKQLKRHESVSLTLRERQNTAITRQLRVIRFDS